MNRRVMNNAAPAPPARPGKLLQAAATPTATSYVNRFTKANRPPRRRDPARRRHTRARPGCYHVGMVYIFGKDT